MNLDTLENKIGFQLGFLKHSDKTLSRLARLEKISPNN